MIHIRPFFNCDVEFIYRSRDSYENISIMTADRARSMGQPVCMCHLDFKSFYLASFFFA